MPLTGKQRRQLRALGHSLEPVVQVGRAGLTESVLAEIGTALQAHELIKLKFGKESPADAESSVAEVERGFRSDVVQVIGRVLLVYRARPQNPTIRLVGARAKHREPPA